MEIYTALAYQGPAILRRIKGELSALLQRDGFSSVHDAVGADHNRLGQAAVAPLRCRNCPGSMFGRLRQHSSLCLQTVEVMAVWTPSSFVCRAGVSGYK